MRTYGLSLALILFKKNKDILSAFSKLDGIARCSALLYVRENKVDRLSSKEEQDAKSKE